MPLIRRDIPLKIDTKKSDYSVAFPMPYSSKRKIGQPDSKLKSSPDASYPLKMFCTK